MPEIRQTGKYIMEVEDKKELNYYDSYILLKN
jgi:hypothetical protein